MKPKSEIRVLVAEDDFLICEDIGRILKQIGYQVAGLASNGEKAVKMAVSLHPDLVLLDIQMPILDGLEASRQIQEKCRIPAIILTAHDTEDLIRSATDAGVMSYLVKPPNAREIERAISISLARFEDLSELRKTKTDLQKSLSEKETLLKEIHHRVTNNLTVVSSLLNLQLNVVKDEKAKEALRDSCNRVQTMSQIHETLSLSDSLSAIDMKTYLSNLGKMVLQGYDAGNIQVRTEAENILIGAKQAATMGLIVNELITNTVKYAFPDKQAGEIKIRLQKTEEHIEIEYSDNGVGMPKDLDWKKSNSLGLRLVKAMTEKQLLGSIKLDTTNGTKYTITFDLTP